MKSNAYSYTTFRIATVLAALTCALNFATPVNAIDSATAVEFKLATEFVYPGEMPRLRILMKAPSGNAADVVKADRVLATGALVCNLFRIDGTRVPGGLPNDGVAVVGKDDFVRIPAAGQQLIETATLTRPTSAGDPTFRN